MVGIPAAELFEDGARGAIAAAVRAAGGSEVFFLGRAEDGRVVEVEDFCRGNAWAVPVLRRVVRGWDAAIHNHPGGDLTPSDADLSIAAEFGELGLGFLIVDNEAGHVNPVVKLLRRSAPEKPFDGAPLAAALGPGGPIARRLGERFEARPEQERMAELVGRTLAEAGVSAIEAGTGTGKSLAYLVPALVRAVRAKERVVVSTNTINLQEQLVRKDIPLVLEAFGEIAGEAPGGERPRAVLMKGRANYACLRKVEDLAAAPETIYESETERDEVHSLAAWARRSREGSREELPVPPSPGAWEKVAVEADTCTRTACRLFADCFYYKARREAAAADLVVVNHHLLLSDLAVRRSAGFKSAAVLPPYRHVVLDEAHHLEDVASAHLGEQVTNTGLRRTLGRLRSAWRSGRGLLPALEAMLAARRGEEFAAAARGIEERVLPAHSTVEARLDLAFEAAGAFLDAAGGRRAEAEAWAEGATPSGGEAGLTLRLKPEHRERPEWRRFVSDGRELASAIGLLVAEIAGAILRPLDELEDLPSSAADLQSILLEVTAVAGRLEAAAGALAAFLEPDPPPGEVLWLERRRQRGRDPLIALKRAPLEIGETLAREAYEKLSGVVLTSATLAVSGGFDYLAARVGLDRIERGRLRTLRLPSPFDYERQCVLGVPHDIPDPAGRGFDEAAARALLAAAEASGGRAFFLFTSYRALDRAFLATAAELRKRGFTPLRQGDASRRRLVERFREEEPAVLFATDSFWEGVDVRGGALRLVAIARLPFKVPSEPLQEARAEAIAERGGDPFHEMTVPQAVLRLKQGFGRLVRSRTDRGAILILDRRVLTKGYGRLFLESLPPARLVRGPLSEVLRAIAAACRDAEPKT